MRVRGGGGGGGRGRKGERGRERERGREGEREGQRENGCLQTSGLCLSSREPSSERVDLDETNDSTITLELHNINIPYICLI